MSELMGIPSPAKRKRPPASSEVKERKKTSVPKRVSLLDRSVEDLHRDPEYSTQIIKVGDHEYASVTRIAKDGSQRHTVHPDRHGAYPTGADLTAVMDAALGFRWTKEGMRAEDIAVVLRNRHAKEDVWVQRAKEVILASEKPVSGRPVRTEAEVVDTIKKIIKDVTL